MSTQSLIHYLRRNRRLRHGKSTVDQVTLLTQDIEDSFSAEAVFLDLTATYYTEWRRGLTCKLESLLSDGHRICMNMELVVNRSLPLVSREISNLFLYISYFAWQRKGINVGD